MSIRHSLLLLQPLDTGSIELIVASSESVQEADAVGILTVSAELTLANSEASQEADNVVLEIAGAETLIVAPSEQVQESTTPVVVPDIHLTPASSESVLESSAVVVVTKSTVAVDASETTQEADNITLAGVGELFVTDFSEYTTGVDLSDWTDFWSAGNLTFTAETNAGESYPIGSKQCEYIRTATSRSALTWDDIGTPSDVEIFAKIRISSAAILGTNGIRLYARVGGSAVSEDGYYLEVYDNAIRINKYTSGVSAAIATITSEFDFDNTIIMRFSCVGTALKGKVWTHDIAEPDDWTLETTDSAHASGAVGFGGFDTATDFEVDYFAADTTVTTIESPPEIIPVKWGMSDGQQDTIVLNACYIMGGYNTLASHQVTGVRVYCGATHTSQVRVGMYTGGAADDPVGATLLYDFGLTSGSVTDQWAEIILDPGNYFNLPTDDYIWISAKGNDSGFAIGRVTGGGNHGDFQVARGRFGSTGISTDETTSYPASIPSGGSFGASWYSLQAIIEEASTSTELIVDASEAVQEAENVVVRLGGVLAVADSEQAQEADAIVLTVKSLIALLNSEQLQESSTPVVFQVYHISVDSSESLQESPQVPLIFATGTLTITITLR